MAKYHIHTSVAICIMLLLGLLFGVTACRNETGRVDFTTLESGFNDPPDSIKTSVYWYWISDNISKEGVVKDLQAMKKVGIDRAFIGNIGLDPKETPYGKVKLFSDEWWDILHTALKTAGELGIEIGIFNSPGWSQSGGPWIKPEESMRYLTSTDTIITGGRSLVMKLNKPNPHFQDEKVLAIKVKADYDRPMRDYSPLLQAMPGNNIAQVLIDGDTTRSFTFAASGRQVIDICFPTVFAAQSLTLFPANLRMVSNAALEVKKDGHFVAVKQFNLNRSNDELNVGFYRYAPVVISFPEVRAQEFRLVFDNYSPGSGLSEVALSATPKVERYIEKTLAKMYPTPLPYWQEYQWPMQPAVSDTSYVLKPVDVIDLSDKMQADDTLKWGAPQGTWMIMRMGMTPTLVTNAPASPEGRGLEVDKMSKKHVASHFDRFLGEIRRRIPEADRKTWKVVVEDSYETGGQNWTDGFIADFKKAYHYNPLPYLPVFKGNVVGSQDQSDRFLWDVRRLVADKVAYDYVGGLREVSHKNGLTTWLENYGHWGFPGEFLQYGGQSDEIAGEFWSEGELGNIENRAASSAAHIYGKVKVSAESSTAAGRDFARYPAEMKQRTDRFFTEGINNTLLHVYIEQPDERMPGVNASFGNEFNRHNTWFYDMDIFIKYLKRCNFMLQQGRYVADVAYFIGEDVPKMTGVQNPPLPQGYSFDYINAEVIEHRLTVKDGRFVLPDGLSYKVLVLPELETMRPKLLAKIKELVAAGGIVLGPRPKRSPSLAEYPKADLEVETMAGSLWGNVDSKKVKQHTVGKGQAISGMTLEQLFHYLKMKPDVDLAGNEKGTLFIHRRLHDGDIYFVSNQQKEKIQIRPRFRVTGKRPERWDATTGYVQKLSAFKQSDGATEVPLELNAYESAFIIFREDTNGNGTETNNEPTLLQADTIKGSWQVTFDAAMRGPQEPVTFDRLSDWSKSSDPQIKYYAGKAIYRHPFNRAAVAKGERYVLDLGQLVAIAKVKVNGKPMGGVWTAPYQVDITDAVKAGINLLEIEVVNTWVNRLIGDSAVPEKDRKTWVSTLRYDPDSSLVPAGLLGPVLIRTEENNR